MFAKHGSLPSRHNISMKIFMSSRLLSSRNRLYATCIDIFGKMCSKDSVKHTQRSLPFLCVQQRRRSSASSSNVSSGDDQNSISHSNETDFLTIYKFPYMKHIRIVSRFKLYQAALMVTLCFPVCHQYTKGLIAPETLMYSVMACSGALILMTALSYYATKIVGEIGYSDATKEVQVSTLTFIGSNRNDLIFKQDEILPWSNAGYQLQLGQVFQRLEVEVNRGKKTVFLLSLRFGKTLQPKILNNILGM